MTSDEWFSSVGRLSRVAFVRLPPCNSLTIPRALPGVTRDPRYDPPRMDPWENRFLRDFPYRSKQPEFSWWALLAWLLDAIHETPQSPMDDGLCVSATATATPDLPSSVALLLRLN